MELGLDLRFATAPARSLNRKELRPALQAALARASSAEWFDILTGAGIPCAPINDVRQGLDFAQSIGLDPVVTIGEGSEAIPPVRNPITFSQTPVSYDLVPPAHDGNRAQVLAWLEARHGATAAQRRTAPATQRKVQR